MSTSIISWALEGFVKGGAGKAGGAVVGQILSALGIDDSQTKILDDLREIKEHLNVIEAEIKGLGDSIERLQKALEIDVQKITAMIKEAKVGPAIDTIDTHFGQPKALHANVGAAYINLATILRDAASGKKTNKEALDTFIDNITGTWDVPKAVISISNGLLGEKIGTDEGLLRSWTTLLISLLNQARAKLDQGSYYTAFLNSYMTLESYYAQQVTWQLKGVVLVTNALCYNCPADKPCPEGMGYVQSEEEFGGKLKQQIRRFHECVERLVLSQYDLDNIGIVKGAYDVKSSNGSSFHDVIRTIFSRCDLLAGTLVRGLEGEQENAAGLYGRMICRPCDTREGKGPALQPACYATSTGSATDISNGCITTNWMSSTDRYALLVDRSGANNVNVVRYYWPWPAQKPRPGTPIDPKFQNGLAPIYRDVNTLESTDAANPNAVLVADFVDFSKLNSRPPFADSVSGNGWTVSPVQEARSWVVPTRNDAAASGFILTPEFKAEGRLVISADENEWPGVHPTLWYEMVGPLMKYTGKGTPKLRLFLIGSAGAETAPAPEWTAIGETWIGPRLQVFIMANGKAIEVYNTDKIPGFNLWGRKAPAKSNHNFEVTYDLQLAADATYDLKMVFGVPVRSHWHKKKHPKKDTHSIGGIVGQLTSFRMAWPTH